MKTEMGNESWIASFIKKITDGRCSVPARLAVAQIIKLQIWLQLKKQHWTYCTICHPLTNLEIEGTHTHTQVFHTKEKELIARSVFHALCDLFPSLNRSFLFIRQIFPVRVGKWVHSKRIFLRFGEKKLSLTQYESNWCATFTNTMLCRMEVMKSKCEKKMTPVYFLEVESFVGSEKNWKHTIFNTSVEAIVILYTHELLKPNHGQNYFQFIELN